MYGFLRTPNCQLNQTDGDSYKKSYCGQCHALQKHFGYTSRALLSYDTTLISLLIDAQSQSIKRETKAWCAVFPRKVPPYQCHIPHTCDFLEYKGTLYSKLM